MSEAAAVNSRSVHEFERLDSKYAAGTSKLFSRSDLEKFDDDPMAALDPGDFIGRFITLFGAPDPDDGGFVLRHCQSGLVITAYSGQSGPSYGGGPRWPGPLPEYPAASYSWEQRNAAIEANRDQLNLLATEYQSLRKQMLLAARSQHDIAPIKRRQRQVSRQLHILRSPDGFAAVVESLESLIASAPLSDYEQIDEASDEGPYRVGVKGGASFVTRLSDAEAVEHYFRKVESVGAQNDWAASAAGSALLLRFIYYRPPHAAEYGPRLEAVWLALLARIERLGGEAPARSLWETLSEDGRRLQQLGLLTLPAEALARLRSCEPPSSG